MNRVLPTLHGGSLKITLTVPLTLEICITESVIAWYIPEFRHTVLLLNGFHRLPRFGLLSPPYTPYSPYSTQYYREFGYTPFTVHLMCLDTHQSFVDIHFHSAYLDCLDTRRCIYGLSSLQGILGVFGCKPLYLWIVDIRDYGILCAQRSLDVIDECSTLLCMLGKFGCTHTFVQYLNF